MEKIYAQQEQEPQQPPVPPQQPPVPPTPQPDQPPRPAPDTTKDFPLPEHVEPTEPWPKK